MINLTTISEHAQDAENKRCERGTCMANPPPNERRTVKLW